MAQRASVRRVQAEQLEDEKIFMQPTVSWSIRSPMRSCAFSMSVCPGILGPQPRSVANAVVGY
jgi:hypothetical protein